MAMSATNSCFIASNSAQSVGHVRRPKIKAALLFHRL